MPSTFDPFAETARKGLTEILRFSSRAGESLRSASNTAIEKLDTFQLERKRDSLYRELGELAYAEQKTGATDSSIQTRKDEIIESLNSVLGIIEERLSASRR